MAITTLKIKKFNYLFVLGADRVRINLYDEREHPFAMIFVLSEKEAIGPPVKTGAGDYQIFVHTPHLQGLLDMLRNETTYFHTSAEDPGNSFLSNSDDPFGLK